MNSMPYSIEAEESLLGAMLQNNQAISIALSKINSKDFYNERNKILYESIIELHNRLGNKEDVNGELVLRYLKENGLFEKVFQNDEAYLMRIIDGTPFYQKCKILFGSLLRKNLYSEI